MYVKMCKECNKIVTKTIIWNEYKKHKIIIQFKFIIKNLSLII